MSERIRIHSNRPLCSGCLSCTTTCSMVNESYVSLAAARIQVELSPFGGTHRITVCQQCAKAACKEACPEGAITWISGGYLVVDYDRCTGCRACIEVCPFDALFWNPISERVIKCELCHGDPQCIPACPTGALAIHVVSDRKDRRTDDRYGGTDSAE